METVQSKRGKESLCTKDTSTSSMSSLQTIPRVLALWAEEQLQDPSAYDRWFWSGSDADEPARSRKWYGTT